MNLIDSIEKAISDTLLTLDGNTIDIGYSTPYQTLTKTGSVNLRDDVIANVTNSELDSINYNIELQPEENTQWQLGQNYIRNVIRFDVEASIKNTTIGISKNLINSKINDLIQDIKFIFWNNNTLNNTCTGVRVIRSTRKYNTTNDIINSGKVTFILEVEYSQYGSDTSKIYQ